MIIVEVITLMDVFFVDHTWSRSNVAPRLLMYDEKSTLGILFLRSLAGGSLER